MNFIMKIHVFLIAFNFVQLCVSIQTNLSIINVQTNHIKLLRNKRQLVDYTRWRSNLVTTQEFIVKVDDEGFNPSTEAVSHIVGVNIRQVPKVGEKIIIGGVMVPQIPTVIEVENPVEYTRFVAPTTTKSMDMDDIVYPQIKGLHVGQVPQFAAMKYTHRDDNRPANPLVTRTPALAQQYAPITPVGFSPRPTASPLTPPTLTSRGDPNLPSRTYPLIQHTQSSFEFNDLQPVGYAKDLEDFFATLELDETQNQPTRNIPANFITTLRAWTEESEVTTMKITTADLDAFHMFFNDEDNEIYESKKNVSSSDNDDKYSNQTDLNESDESVLETTTESQEKQNKDHTTYCVTTPAENSSTRSVKMARRRERAQICNLLKYRELSFNSPRTLHEIVLQMRTWADQSPIAKMVDITSNNLTTMDNPINMMIVDDPSSGQALSAKDIVMVLAGIQGRDHHAVTAAMYVLYQLIEHTETHTDLLTKYRFWIIPVFNPDGYDYSSTFTQRREWTKNLHQSWEPCNGHKSCKDCESLGLRCTPQSCYGVNLDRNFEYQWIPAEELRAEHPCGDLYAGSRQISEPETRALTTFLHERGGPISMFVAFKEGDVLGVMYPYSHTRKKRAFDQDYRQRATRAASAAFSIAGRPYVAGQTSEYLPLYAGGIEDYVDGHLGIDSTYTIMMFRTADTYNTNLMTEHVVHEAYAALDTLLLETGNTVESQVQKLQSIRRSAATISSPILLLVLATVIPIFPS